MFELTRDKQDKLLISLEPMSMREESLDHREATTNYLFSWDSSVDYSYFLKVKNERKCPSSYY